VQLRGYQSECKNALFNYFSSHNGHPLAVVPTGGGKSVIHASFCSDVILGWPGQRILSLTHVKELIEQNSVTMSRLSPQIDIGINSAGMKRRDRFNPMIFAGIQSVHNKADQLGRFDLITIDEAHLVPAKNDTMYRRFLDDMMTINDKVKIIGFSATPFRLDSGFLHTGDDALFTDIAYNLPITRLIDEGHLVPLISKAGVERMNTDGMKTVRGDFKTSDMVDEATRVKVAACAEIVEYGQDRNAWLVFCPGVEYAQDVADFMRSRHGVVSECLHGETPKDEREHIISEFKAGRIKCLTNCDILTTGFDAPICDLIAFLRPTQSAALYIQMCGRGMRLNPENGKQDCLVLDFAGNVNRHGPVDTINIIDKLGGVAGEVELAGTAPTKECPDCHAIVAVNARICPHCQYVWPPKHEETASTQAIISTLAQPEWFEVNEVTYRRHEKLGKPDSVKVTYRCGLQFFDEWVCPDHEGYAKTKATRWLTDRGIDPATSAESTTEHVLLGREYLKKPGRIMVRKEGKYDRIVKYDFAFEPVKPPEPILPDWDSIGEDEIPF